MTLTPDLSGARARLRQQFSGGHTLAYRDADQEHWSPLQPVALSPKNEGFEDLDIPPLEPRAMSSALSTDEHAELEPRRAPVTPHLPAQNQLSQSRLDPQRMRRILFLATTVPGGEAPYGRTQGHKPKMGLIYGLGGFAQADGSLGRLLALMEARDAEGFRSIFGPNDDFPEADAAELLATTNAQEPSSDSPELPARMAPVSGRALSDPLWTTRFKAAARVEAFQNLQYRLGAETKLLPLLSFAADLGLTSEKALTILTERAIALGTENALAFAITATGPINTDAMRRAALDHVFGADRTDATIADFQASRGIDDVSGHFGPRTHAALVAALREHAPPPLPIPSQAMMLDRLVQTAEASETPGLVRTIRENDSLDETPMSLDAPEMGS